MKTFKFYSDPSHGWLAVKRQLLRDLKIINDISSYSYQRGKTVYLEEDSDAQKFINAFEKKHGQKGHYIEKITDRPHPIRSYQGFKILWSERPPSPLFKQLTFIHIWD